MQIKGLWTELSQPGKAHFDTLSTGIVMLDSFAGSAGHFYLDKTEDIFPIYRKWNNIRTKCRSKYTLVHDSNGLEMLFSLHDNAIDGIE